MWRGHPSLTVAVNHTHGAIEEISQPVPEIRIRCAYEALQREVAVVGSWYLTQEKIAQRVGAVLLCQENRVDNIANRFAHLLTAHQYVPVHEYGRRQGNAGREEHGRPVNGMEPDDAFSYHMHSLWILHPVVLIERPVIRIIQRSDIVAQGVEPDIHYLLRVSWNWNPPATCPQLRPRDAEILQTASNEAQDLVSPR